MNIILTAILVTTTLVVFMLPATNLQRVYVNCPGTKCLCDNWSRELSVFRSRINRFANRAAQLSCAARYCGGTTNSTGFCRSQQCRTRTTADKECSISRVSCNPKLGVDPYGDYVYILQIIGRRQRVQERVCRTPFKKCCSCSPRNRCIQNYRTIIVIGINLTDGRCGIHYLKSCCGCSCGTCCK